MIEVRKFKTNHQFRVYWNKYAKTEQYTWIVADCFCVYIFGILIYKRVVAPNV